MEDADYADPKLDEALAKVGGKMEKTVEWAKAILYDGVERSRGRVSPCESNDIVFLEIALLCIPLPLRVSVTMKARHELND